MRNAKSYDLARIQTDGDRLIFAEQLTEKDKFHLKSQFLDKQKREMIIGEMMLNSERTVPSVTCMLLMLGTIKTACQSFYLITPTSFTQTEHDAVVEELVKQLYCDPSRIWNSVELYKQYEVLAG